LPVHDRSLDAACVLPVAELESGPFFVAEARQVGLTWKALQTPRWKRLSRGQYANAQLARNILLALRAAAHRMPAGYAFSGRTAGWLHGLDMSPVEPVEVTVDRAVPVRARAGVRLRRAALADSEVIPLKGFRTTSALRTVRDLGSGRDLAESVVAIDMAVRAEVVELPDLLHHIATHPGQKGIRRLRRATSLADPRCESPMETRLRLHLVKAGLPTPGVQVDLEDPSGRFLARADLYYADQRLVIEYDGDNHRERLVSDLRRQNALLNAGYKVLRFTAADLKVPNSVVAQVRDGLALGSNRGRWSGLSAQLRSEPGR
jgi:very-short-patch-repair endonuclease